jgi:hypothetical protein
LKKKFHLEHKQHWVVEVMNGHVVTWNTLLSGHHKATLQIKVNWLRDGPEVRIFKS